MLTEEVALHLTHIFGIQKYMLEYINNPRWDDTTRVHDWRNYVPENVRCAWLELSEFARAAIIHITDEMANREEWD